MANEHFRDLEARRGDISRHQENGTRPARVFAEFQAVGVGSIVYDEVFDFGCAFISRPTFHADGSLDEDSDLPDDPPRYYAGVYQWRRSADGYYTGAWCHFQVDTYSVVPDDFTTIFHLSWEGMASKDFISSHTFPVNALDINYGN